MEFDQTQTNHNTERALLKIWNRLQNSVRYVSHNLVADDKNPMQLHQTTGFDQEVRDKVIRIQQFGFSTSPPIGSKGLVLTGVPGDQSNGVIISTDDPRYRPNGTNQNELKSGEIQSWMVDSPNEKDGTEGKMRLILKGAKGWITTMFGKTINIGDPNVTTCNIGTKPDNDLTINIGQTKNVTINMNGKTVNINGTNGDVKVSGVSLVNHTHPDPQGGNTGPPNKS